MSYVFAAVLLLGQTDAQEIEWNWKHLLRSSESLDMRFFANVDIDATAAATAIADVIVVGCDGMAVASVCVCVCDIEPNLLI